MLSNLNAIAFWGCVALMLLNFQRTSGQDFAPVRLHPLGARSHPVDVVLNDVNCDGYLDVLVANFYGDNVGVLLGRENGRLASVRRYSTGRGSHPNNLSVGDINGDGWVDVIVANTNGNPIGILLGQPTSGFAPVQTFPAGSPSLLNPTVALADLNGDQRLDLVSLHPDADAVGVWLGQAGAAFAAPVFYPTGRNSQPSGSVLGDLNRDGYLDLVVETSHEDSLVILLGRDQGRFGPARAVFTGTQSFPGPVAMGDVNGDGYLDVVVNQHEFGDAKSVGRVGILLGQADGGLAPIYSSLLGTRENVSSVMIRDVTHDGQADLVLTLNSGQIEILPSQVGGGFNPPRHYSTGRGRYRRPSRVAVGDVDGDGRLDLVVVNTVANNIGVLLQKRPSLR